MLKTQLPTQYTSLRRKPSWYIPLLSFSQYDYSNNNIPSVNPQLGSGKSRVYANLSVPKRLKKRYKSKEHTANNGESITMHSENKEQ